MAQPNGWRAWVIPALVSLVPAATGYGILLERVNDNTSAIATGILPNAEKRMSVVEDDLPEIEADIGRLREDFIALRDGRIGDRYTEAEARQERLAIEARLQRLERQVEQLGKL